MGNPFISKGTTITITATTPSISQDIKAVVIEDVELGVGVASPSTIRGSDGTKYNFAGEEDDNTLEIPVILTDDTITAILQSIYGTGTVVGTTTTWDLQSAGSVTNQIAFVPPDTDSDTAISITAVNAKGLGITLKMQLENGWVGTISYTPEKYQLAYDSDTTD